jgi:uncharacterized protein (DUF1800 family)
MSARAASRPAIRKAAAVLVAGLFALSASLALATKKDKKTAAAAAQMDESKAALHALNRLTFGPRPGDVARIRAIGVDKWIDEQLHPERIDDSAVEARLSGLLTLKMKTREIVENFPPPQVIKAIDEGKVPLPSDPKERAIYQAELADYRERKQVKAEKAVDQDAAANSNPQQLSPEERAARRDARLQTEERADALLDMPPDQRYEAILRMSPDERRAVAKGLDPDARQRMMSDLSPRQRETVQATIANPQQVVALELQQGKLLRAIYSERQLDEVMTDFWFNHFNVFLGKGADRYLITSYERDVIRPHAMGKFKDLLEATAKSPAMLFYLDNWLSVGPNSAVALNISARNRNRIRVLRGPFGGPVIVPRPQRPQNRQRQAANKKRQGLNENYGRELMELHTLGVNGGYTQRDVSEVAKVFTGWTIREPRKGGDFEFNDRLHEPGPKYVLGHTIKQHGEKEGQELLELLAKQPATAKFISRKLAMRFVSDDPPQALVDRMAETFLKKDGDIRAVLLTMFHSPEFWAPGAYRAKVKTPLEFVASAVRASGAEVSNPLPLVQMLNGMGMPLFGMQPPTGYSMKADAWVNSAALLSRLNFALALGGGRLKGIQIDPARVLPEGVSADANATLAALENELLAGDISRNTHDTILTQMNDPQLTGRRLDDPERPPQAGVLAGLLLGSPEFQRR